MKNSSSININHPSAEEMKELSTFLLKEASAELLSDEQEKNLVRQIQNGNDDALVELLSAHMRFVVAIAKLYVNNGLNIEEMIAEGTRGLVKAAEKYDDSKGSRFINYAIWWIRATIIEAIINKKPNS